MEISTQFLSKPKYYEKVVLKLVSQNGSTFHESGSLMSRCVACDSFTRKNLL